jgi:repressor LexA
MSIGFSKFYLNIFQTLFTFDVNTHKIGVKGGEIMFKKNLRYQREKAHMSQLELAKRLDRTDATISQWENGASVPRQKTLKDIAKIFSVNVDDLLYKDMSNEQTAPAHTSVRIKVYGTVPAGIPTEAITDIVDWQDIPQEWTTGGREYFGLKVRGDSMYPKYQNGDTIICRKQPDCESGQDAVVYVNGCDATLKRVLKQKEQIVLQPINSAYEPRIYRYDDIAHPVIIAGVVIELRRTV